MKFIERRITSHGPVAMQLHANFLDLRIYTTGYQHFAECFIWHRLFHFLQINLILRLILIIGVLNEVAIR
jgi:hypothetical protein